MVERQTRMFFPFIFNPQKRKKNIGRKIQLFFFIEEGSVLEKKRFSRSLFDPRGQKYKKVGCIYFSHEER